MSRRKLDQYYTPASAAEMLRRHMEHSGELREGDTIWEPASGHGAIARPFAKYDIFMSDLDPPDGALMPTLKGDFLSDDSVAEIMATFEVDRFDWIITNPPYRQATDFVHQAMGLSIGVAMLMRLTYLEPANKRNPRRDILKDMSWAGVLPERLSFTGDGKKDFTTHVWCVWSPRCPYIGSPQLIYLEPLGGDDG